MNVEATPREVRPIYLLMLGIAAWALILAGGVVWYDYAVGAINWWKPTIIVVATALFLGIWGIALRTQRNQV